MGKIDASPITIAPLLLKNLITSIFIYADKSFLTLAEKHKLLEIIRYILVTCFLFLLRVLPSFFSSLDPYADDNIKKQNSIDKNPWKSQKGEAHVPGSAGAGGDSGIARALSQLLSIVNDIPVSSRKYEVVRSLAERLIDENRLENVQPLRDVNRAALSAAFSRTLGQLEAAMMELGRDQIGNGGSGSGPVQFRLKRVFKAVKDGALGRPAGMAAREGVSWSGGSAEKLAAELLWLAQKLAACEDGEEAIWRWASASNLAWLALSAEPRLQGCLVKISAFLFKQAKDLGLEDFEEGRKEHHRQTKKKMLVSWLPLLCRASNGTDTPILSTSERAELERVLEEIIEKLQREEDQEQVLSLWLHHFTHCPSSDWPNLRASYARWCTASRKHLILQSRLKKCNSLID